MNGMFDAMSTVNTVGSRVNGYAVKWTDVHTYRMTSLSARRDHHFGERVNADTLLIVYDAPSNELQPFRPC